MQALEIEAFTIRHGIMTMMHAYTNDQRLADIPHRISHESSCAENIIPTTYCAARAVDMVLPQLKGKLDGIAARVPVADGSVVDLVAESEQMPDRDTITLPSGRPPRAHSRGSSNTPMSPGPPATSSVTRTVKSSTHSTSRGAMVMPGWCHA